jgi:hypothetical protein
MRYIKKNQLQRLGPNKGGVFLYEECGTNSSEACYHC